MPAECPHIRHSEWLKAKINNICKPSMATQRPPHSRGRGYVTRGARGRGAVDISTTPTLTQPTTHLPAPSTDATTHLEASISRIRWDPKWTTILVQYLDTHPAECRVLFYESKKARDPSINEPSPGSKSKIWANIAEAVFHHDAEYGTTYIEDSNKFVNVVNNHLTYLKTKYKKHHASFRQTGAGVNPLDASGAKNLREQVLIEFPWYDVLDGLWKDHPAFAPTTISSAPGVDHASGLMALTQGKGKGKDQHPAPPLLMMLETPRSSLTLPMFRTLSPKGRGRGRLPPAQF
ncbi:hypothetical protein BDR05DRAFT_949032 [Suillus weaverae]|nr:hypothetical protein BDR05DRAFT_949032 [Suillus weaverae]